MQTHVKSRGFTLIEMLVVVAIIAVLAAVILPELNGARADARDTKRMSDLEQINVVLRLYADAYGHYPKESEGYNGTICEGCSGKINTLLAEYMGEVPTDPINDENHHYYYDAWHACNGYGERALLLARTMENESRRNFEDIPCSELEGEHSINSRRDDSYFIIVGPGSS